MFFKGGNLYEKIQKNLSGLTCACIGSECNDCRCFNDKRRHACKSIGNEHFV